MSLPTLCIQRPVMTTALSSNCLVGLADIRVLRWGAAEGRFSGRSRSRPACRAPAPSTHGASIGLPEKEFAAIARRFDHLGERLALAYHRAVQSQPQ